MNGAVHKNVYLDFCLIRISAVEYHQIISLRKTCCRIQSSCIYSHSYRRNSCNAKTKRRGIKRNHVLNIFNAHWCTIFMIAEDVIFKCDNSWRQLTAASSPPPTLQWYDHATISTVRAYEARQRWNGIVIHRRRWKHRTKKYIIDYYFNAVPGNAIQLFGI